MNSTFQKAKRLFSGTLVTLSVLSATGCMKQAIGGLGLGWDDEKHEAPVAACPANVVASYANAKLSNTDPTLKHQYEVTFNCSLDGIQ